MAETFESQYEEYAKIPEFASTFGSKTEFENFVNENEDASELLKSAYGIEFSEVKKKDEAENFTFQSPSVGETSEIPEIPMEEAEQVPQLAVQGGSEPKQEDPRLKNIRTTLQDNIDKIKNNQSPFGAFIEIQKLSKNPDYQAFKNSGKMDDLLGDLNETFNSTFLSNPNFKNSFNTPKSKQDLENIGIGLEAPSKGEVPVKTELGEIADMGEPYVPLDPDFAERQEIQARLYSGGAIAQRGMPGYRVEQEAVAKEQADEFKRKASEPKLSQNYDYDGMGRKVARSESQMETAHSSLQPITNDLRDFVYLTQTNPTTEQDQEEDTKAREFLANKIYDKVKGTILPSILPNIKDNFDNLSEEGIFFKRDIDGFLEVNNGYIAEKLDKYFLGKKPGEEGYIPDTPIGNEYRRQLRGIFEGKLRAEYRAVLDEKIAQKELGEFKPSEDESEVLNSINLIKSDVEGAVEQKKLQFKTLIDKDIEEGTAFFKERKKMLAPENFTSQEEYEEAILDFNEEVKIFSSAITEKQAQFSQEFSQFANQKEKEYAARIDELQTIFENRTTEEFKDYQTKKAQYLKEYRQSQIDKNAFDFGDGNKYGMFADFLQSSVANFLRSTIEQTGVKDLNIGFVNRAINDVASFATGNAYMGNSLSNARNFSEGFGAFAQQMIDQLPTIGGGALVTAMTGSPLLASSFLMYSDMARETISVRDDIMNGGGSLAQADRAAKQVVNAHFGMLPFYFAQGSLLFGNKVGSTSFYKNYAKSLPLEYIPELAQELIQQYTSDKQTGKLFKEVLNSETGEIELQEKSMREWLATTGKDLAIDVLPTVAAFGGVQARGETVRARQIETQYSEVASFLGEKQQLDYFNELYTLMGENAVYALPDMLRFRGEITQQEYNDLRAKLPGYVEKIQETQDAGIMNLEDSRYYLNRLQVKETLEKQKTSARSESAKAAVQKKINLVDKNLSDIIEGKKVPYAKITFANGVSVIMDNQELNGYLNNLNNSIAKVLTNETRDAQGNAVPIASLETEDAALNKKLNKLFDLQKERTGSQTVTGMETEVSNKIDYSNDNSTGEVAVANGVDETITQARFEQARKAQEILTEAMPGVEIVMLNDEDYKALMPKVGGNVNSNGNFSYSYDKKTKSYKAQIQINAKTSNSRTINHELTHALLLQKFGEDLLAYEDFKKGLSKVLKDSDIENLENFATSYAELDKSDEFLAEGGAAISEAYEGSVSDLKKSKLQNIASYVSNYVSNLTGGQVNLFKDLNNVDAAIDFFNTLSQKTNAVQEQTTSQVPVQPETAVSEEVAQGETQAEPEVATEAQEVSSKSQVVYHAGTLQGEGNIYVTPDKEQADAYGRESGNEIIELNVDPSQLASEDYVKNKIQELGYTSPGGTIDELMIPMLMDQRYDESALKPEEIENVKNILKEEGYSGISFMDEDMLQRRKEGIENYMIFDTKDLGQETAGLENIENPLTTEDVEGREIEQGYEVFDEVITIDASKGKSSRKPIISKSQIERDFEINDDDFADVESIDGKKMVGFLGDVQLAGSVVTPTGLTLRGYGGPNFVKQSNRNLKKDANGYYKGRAAVWASTFEDSTGKLMKRFKNAEGALIGAQQISGVLGNRKMLIYFGEELKLSAEKNSEAVVLDLINQKIKTQFKKDKNTGITSTFSENLGGVESFSSIDEFIDYLDPYMTSNQFVAKYPNSQNITQKDGKKVTLLEATNTKKAAKVVSYEFRAGLFVKMFNIEGHKKFGLPSIVSGKGYSYENTVLEYANDTMFAEAAYGDFVGYIEFDPATLKLEKVDSSSDFYNPSYEWVITAEKVRFKYFKDFLDGRALFYDSASASEKANQTPFGLRPKAAAARAIMGSQPITTIDATKVKERQKGFVPESKSQLIQPSSDKWSPSLTQAEVDAVVGGDFGNTLDEKVKEGKKHSTQIATTIGTYNKWAGWLEQNVPNFKDAKVLDVGAGLGHIHKAFKGKTDNVESYEPFYDKEQYQKYAGVQKPNYSKMDASDVPTGQYDVVVNNAVLNVVPADIRESIVNTIGNAMKPGGIGILNSMSQDYLNSLIKKIDRGASKNIKLSDTEVFVRESGKNSYQKGWTNQELQSYVQDVLGDGFTVEKAPGAITSMATVLIRKNEVQSKSQQTEATETDFKLPFGKFQGEWYTTTPKSYRDWLSKQPWFDPRDYLKKPEIQSKSQLDANQINAEFNQMINQGGSVSDSLDNLIRMGYGKKDIQAELGKATISDDLYNKRIAEIGYNAYKDIQDMFADRKADLMYQIQIRNGMPLGDIRAEMLAEGYNDIEIFNALVSGDFALVEELEEVFGSEFRNTVKNLFDQEDKVANLEFLDDMSQDARNAKIMHRFADVVGMFQESGLAFADASVMIEYLLNEMALPTEVAAKALRQQLSDLFEQLEKKPGKFEKEVENKENLTRFSELLSFAGRILATGRGLFPRSMADIIEQSLAKDGIVLTAKQRQTLNNLIGDFNNATRIEKEKLAEVEAGDISDQKLNEYQEAQKQLGFANVKLMQFLNARKPTYWNEVISSGGSRGLLNLSTVVLSLVSNVENLIYTSWDPFGMTVRKVRNDFGSGIAGNTLSFRNWRLAYSLSRRNSWNEMNMMAKYGNLGSSIDKNFDNFGTINFFREPQIAYKYLSTLVKQIAGKEPWAMTDEEFVDAMDLTLQKLEDGSIKTRNGKTYNIAKAIAFSTIGVGSQITEGIGRTMAYGGDIAFGKLAATRAMIDYFTNINNAKFKDGLFENFLDGKDKLSEEGLRAMVALMSSQAEMNDKFEDFGLRRVFMNDNKFSKLVAGGRGFLKKGIREKGRQINRGEVGKLSATAALKQVQQVGDVVLWAAMPFIKVPVNFLGSAIAKSIPLVSLPKYFNSERQYQKAWKEFKAKYPEGKEIKNKKEYEKAKVDLFLKKRQVTHDSAQVMTSLEITMLSALAYASGALVVGGEPEKEKQLKTVNLKGNTLNITLFSEYVSALAQGKDVKNFFIKRGGHKPGDTVQNISNFGIVGYGMGFYGSLFQQVRESKNKQLMDVQNPGAGYGLYDVPADVWIRYSEFADVTGCCSYCGIVSRQQRRPKQSC
jgi:2-polyprenyl-3-methyl-5-hydroxy-6-metoxy-1,4-benzoquinol methylase